MMSDDVDGRPVDGLDLWREHKGIGYEDEPPDDGPNPPEGVPGDVALDILTRMEAEMVTRLCKPTVPPAVEYFTFQRYEDEGK